MRTRQTVLMWAAIVVALMLVPVVVALLYFNPLLLLIFGLVVAVVVTIVYFVNRRKARTVNELTGKVIESRPERLRNILWDPMNRELREVVAAEGVVTDHQSAWTGVGAFARRETTAKFQYGADEYLKQRRKVFELSSELPQDGPLPAGVQTERDKLLRMSDELLAQVSAAIRSQLPTPQPQTDPNSEAPSWKKYEGL